MWTNQKMKFAAFIHNDDLKCFHVVIQGSHKLVVMGCINIEDHALIKRQQACIKMNVMGEKLKDEKKGVTVENNFHLLLEIVCVYEVLQFITTCVQEV